MNRGEFADYWMPTSPGYFLDHRCIEKLAKSEVLQRVINQIILACDIDELEKEAAQYAHDH